MTGYHVERCLAKSDRWLKVNKGAVTELKLTVTDLVDGNEYQFRISAENKVGVGPPSSPCPPFVAKDAFSKCSLPFTPFHDSLVLIDFQRFFILFILLSAGYTNFWLSVFLAQVKYCEIVGVYHFIVAFLQPKHSFVEFPAERYEPCNAQLLR